MLTRCPHCETTFRVTSEQLTARQGSVRCGSCREVFNALESLADEMPAGVVHEPLPDKEVWADAPAPRRWPWALGLAASLLLAAIQLVYIFRVEIAVLSPELRPTLVAACELAGCAVPLPRKPELLGIETSDLAPAEGERLLLTATLKNRAPFAQEYPHLELSLTDTQDAALLRKVLTPADYLPGGQTSSGGFEARGELSVKLKFEARGVPAIGYRLYLFYP